jgi:hypothetical protein
VPKVCEACSGDEAYPAGPDDSNWLPIGHQGR